MIIHGVRFYPQTVSTTTTPAGKILFHGRLSKKYSDLYYIFRPLTAAWADLILEIHCARLSESGDDAQAPERLHERFGAELEELDFERRTAFVRGSSFPAWAPNAHSIQADLIRIFDRVPSPQCRKRLDSAAFRLRPSKWPKELRAVIQMWDDIYWQLFTPVESYIETLISSHSNDPLLKAYHVDLTDEFPEPGDKKLRPVCV